MFSLDLMIVAAFLDLLKEVVDSFGVVPHAKWLSQNVPVTITAHDGVFLFGIVHCYDKDLLAVTRLFVDLHEVLTLLLKDGSLFHVKFLSILAARPRGSHGGPRRFFDVPRASCPMAVINKIGHSHFIGKVPRVSEGKASRACLKAHSLPLHETLGKVPDLSGISRVRPFLIPFRLECLLFLIEFAQPAYSS